jgi:hypothetical protein
MMNQQVAITVIIVLFVLGRFLVRELRERRFAIARIYVLPGVLGAIGVVLIGLSVVNAPQATGVLAIACVAAVIVGAGIGYAVARFTTVRVTNEPGVLYARGSFATVAIWIVALLLRLVPRLALIGGGPRVYASGESIALNAALLVLLASALFFVRFRLVAAAKLERARGISSTLPAV